jgi:hypothetical protein
MKKVNIVDYIITLLGLAATIFVIAQINMK